MNRRPKDHPDQGEVKAITVRMSREDYQRLQAYADTRNLSLNSVVNEAVAQYTVRAQREEALHKIKALRQTIAASCAAAPAEDGVEMLARLRLERAEHLAQFAGSSGAAPKVKPTGDEV